MSRAFTGALLAALLVPAGASAYTDTSPQTDFGAETLKQTEFRLGLGRFEVGATDDFTFGTTPLLWLFRVKNLLGKWRFVNDGAHAFAASSGLYWLNARDFDEDNADVTVYCVPLRLSYTFRESNEFRYHFTLSYTAVGTRGEGGDTVEVQGVGLVDTAVFNPTFEWDLVREFAVLVDLSVVLFQRARGNSDQHYVFDEYTTLDLHQDAEADLKSGFQAWLAAGVMLSLDTFNLRLLGGYGNYVVPVVNFSVPDAIPMIDADIFWRF